MHKTMATSSSVTPSTYNPTASGTTTPKTSILKRPRCRAVKKKSCLKPVLLSRLRFRYASRRPSSQTSLVSCGSSSSTGSTQDQHEDHDRTVKVSFRPRVRVKRIPNRHSYSAADRQAMWMPKAELRAMIMRNHAQAAFERSNHWLKAPEENDFMLNDNGERVHPVELWAQQRKQVVPSRTVSDSDDDDDMSEEEETENESE